MELSDQQAIDILNVLKEHEFITQQEIDDNVFDLSSLARYWIGEAEKAWVQNNSVAKNDEAIRTVLNMSPEGFPVVEPKREGFVSQALEIEAKLPIPKEVDFDYTHLPDDFTELTDTQIRRFSSHNQHFLNRARYLLAGVVNHNSAATHLRDEAYRQAYKKAADEKKATRDYYDLVAKEDETYKKYDADVRNDLEQVNIYKALVEIYSGNVERLSREWTMRQNEWEKSR